LKRENNFVRPEWKANCCVQWPELASQMIVVYIHGTHQVR